MCFIALAYYCHLSVKLFSPLFHLCQFFFVLILLLPRLLNGRSRRDRHSCRLIFELEGVSGFSRVIEQLSFQV